MAFCRLHMAPAGWQGLELLVGALHKFLSMHYLRIDVAEFGSGGGGGELPPVVDNDLVTITPVLLEACGTEQARPRAARTDRPRWLKRPCARSAETPAAQEEVPARWRPRRMRLALSQRCGCSAGMRKWHVHRLVGMFRLRAMCARLCCRVGCSFLKVLGTLPVAERPARFSSAGKSSSELMSMAVMKACARSCAVWLVH